MSFNVCSWDFESWFPLLDLFFFQVGRRAVVRRWMGMGGRGALGCFWPNVFSLHRAALFLCCLLFSGGGPFPCLSCFGVCFFVSFAFCFSSVPALLFVVTGGHVDTVFRHARPPPCLAGAVFGCASPGFWEFLLGGFPVYGVGLWEGDFHGRPLEKEPSAGGPAIVWGGFKRNKISFMLYNNIIEGGGPGNA